MSNIRSFFISVSFCLIVWLLFSLLFPVCCFCFPFPGGGFAAGGVIGCFVGSCRGIVGTWRATSTLPPLHHPTLTRENVVLVCLLVCFVSGFEKKCLINNVTYHCLLQNLTPVNIPFHSFTTHLHEKCADRRRKPFFPRPTAGERGAQGGVVKMLAHPCVDVTRVNVQFLYKFLFSHPDFRLPAALLCGNIHRL